MIETIAICVYKLKKKFFQYRFNFINYRTYFLS